MMLIDLFTCNLCAGPGSLVRLTYKYISLDSRFFGYTNKKEGHVTGP